MDTENQVNIAKKSTFSTPAKKAGVSKAQTPRTVAVTPKTTSTRPKTAQTCSKLFQSERIPFSPMSSSNSVCSNSTAGDAREAARIAKLQQTSERIQKVAQLKEKWAQEKEHKIMTHKERRQYELRKLQEDTETAAELRRKNIEKLRVIEEQEKQKKQETLSESLKARSQLAVDLEKQAKAKRRISVFLNGQMRKRATEKEAQLQAQKKQQEVELLASRRLDFLQIREAKREEEDRRRESLHHRIVQSQEEKRIAEELEQKRKQEELELLEVRHANWEDDLNFKKTQEMARRESLAFRSEEWRAVKAKEAELQQQQEHEELDLLKTRGEGWKDIQNYKQDMERSKRESLAGRLDKWREEKNLTLKQKETMAVAEEMNRELEQQAVQDVKQYQESIKESRRQSLAYRLDKAKKDNDFENGQKALHQMVNEELRRIEELDRQDVTNYRQRIMDARRQSLEYRNQTEYQERMRLEGEKQAQKMAETADRELRDEAWRDVQHYLEEQREERRKSLAWRLADAQRQQEVELAAHVEKLDKMHLDLQCRREDWVALQEYKAEEQERRRMSVAVRLDSWRQQKLTKEKERERQEMIAEEEAIYREMDREAVMLAKKDQEAAERFRNLTTFNI